MRRDVLLSFLTPSAMDTLGNMYAFGATLAYTLVFVSLIVLRFRDPLLAAALHHALQRQGQLERKDCGFPGSPSGGMIGVSLILFEVILTHDIGRIAGPFWVLLCVLYYAFWRRRNSYSVFCNVAHDWKQEQIAVLTNAEEFEMLEEHKEALAKRR